MINRIFLLFDARKSCVFQIFLLRSIKAYLCPNIINFDSVDFSECRPEEVMFLLMLSVFMFYFSLIHVGKNLEDEGENFLILFKFLGKN